jgi:hypothetical protein
MSYACLISACTLQVLPSRHSRFMAKILHEEYKLWSSSFQSFVTFVTLICFLLLNLQTTSICVLNLDRVMKCHSHKTIDEIIIFINICRLFYSCRRVSALQSLITGFLAVISFTWVRRWPTAQPPWVEGQGIALSDLFPKSRPPRADPTSSYVTAGTNLEALEARKPPHPIIHAFIKMRMLSWRVIIFVLLSFCIG